MRTMKNSHRQTIFTLAFAVLIIAFGFLSFRYYSEDLKNRTLYEKKDVDVDFEKDTSLEKVILDKPWEQEGWSNAEEISLPVKYKAIVSEVCDTFRIPEKEDDIIYKKEKREFLIKYQADGKQINIYINENTCEFSFCMEEISEEGDVSGIDNAVKKIEEQKADQESEMYKLIVDLSRCLSANRFLTLGMYDESELLKPEYMKRDLIECENIVFAHDDKVYFVLRPEYIFENNNFISLVYDSKTNQYCGCKFTIVNQ